MTLPTRIRRAQGATEYVLLVGVLALLLTLAVSQLQGSLEGAYEQGVTRLDPLAAGDPNRPFELRINNPYEWSPETGGWIDPEHRGRFVSFAEVERFDPGARARLDQ